MTDAAVAALGVGVKFAAVLGADAGIFEGKGTNLMRFDCPATSLPAPEPDDLLPLIAEGNTGIYSDAADWPFQGGIQDPLPFSLADKVICIPKS